MTIDHTQLITPLVKAAEKAFLNAHAPYSNFKVGAAAMTASGVIVSGCNVENASYGLTVCAERNCIAQGVVQGAVQFSQLVIYTKQETLTPPCGACRQVIAEFFQQDGVITAVNHLQQQKQWTVAQLLPDAFLPDHLAK